MQLHQLEEQVKETHTKILAISVDNADKAQAMQEKTGGGFDFLCDENLEVIKAYGLVDPSPMVWDYVDGKTRKVPARSIALSANVIINQQGTILSTWHGHYNYRPSHEDTLKILKEI